MVAHNWLPQNRLLFDRAVVKLGLKFNLDQDRLKCSQLHQDIDILRLRAQAGL